MPASVHSSEKMDEHNQTTSPGVSPVQLSDCIEHLLHFTLSCSINETLEIDLGLSKDYCSILLQDDPHQSNTNNLDTSRDGGVPSYPLYKRLASALHNCISSGSYLKSSEQVMSFEKDDSIERRKDDWNKLIQERGYELMNMLKAVDFQLHVQEPFFSQLRAGVKTTEGRCAVGEYNKIQTGAFLLFNKCLLLEVQDVDYYATFTEMLEAKNLEKVLPGVRTIEEGSKFNTHTILDKMLASYASRST